VVQIADPTAFDGGRHQRYVGFARSLQLLQPKDVAYTIFPRGLYRGRGDGPRMFIQYNRQGGMYQRLMRRAGGGWGTYFRRMTNFDAGRGSPPVNQLLNIIEAMNSRAHTYQAAYTIVIQRPGSETVRPRGGPCLNYIAVQLQSGTPQRVSFLCVYRNHDFLTRAYGNYWGLCDLLKFLAAETQSQPGSLTCVSAHAYACYKLGQLRSFLGSFP